MGSAAKRREKETVGRFNGRLYHAMSTISEGEMHIRCYLSIFAFARTRREETQGNVTSSRPELVVSRRYRTGTSSGVVFFSEKVPERDREESRGRYEVPGTCFSLYSDMDMEYNAHISTGFRKGAICGAKSRRRY